ncbi:MAG: FKBP-type peptidyl-prolyl cis-trans isomerase [Acidibacter sp.]|jgi:FKBP-type peptidyl-prolyl cis-trans isomerase|nr:FKBP-type peptidyl-prolyl cis-trans isomerase [Acidibacter sp.]
MRSVVWSLILAVTGIFLISTFLPTLLASSSSDQSSMESAMSELVKEDIEAGDGSPINAGQIAVVHYTGWLHDPAQNEGKGRKFDSSHDHGDTFAFKVGGGQVIRGWDLGVEGMRVGGKRRLVIPAELGYGARGAGGVIPGGATLVFDVELMEIR